MKDKQNVFIHILMEIHGHTEEVYELGIKAKVAEISTKEDCDIFLKGISNELTPESIDKILDVRNQLK